MFRNASILTSRHAFLAQLYVDYRYLSSRRTITKGKTGRKIGEMEERRMFAWITYSRFKINPLKEHQRWKRKYPLFHPLALHTRRVVHRVFTNNRVPTSSTLVSFHRTRRESSRKQTLIRRRTPPLIPRAGHLFLFPCLHAAREQHGLVQKEKSTHPVCVRSTRAVVIRFQRGGSFSFFLLSFFLGGRMEWRGDVDSSGKETRRKRKGARLTSVLVMAWRIGRDWIEPTRNTSGLNERGWATETAEVGQRETASAALGVGVGWLSGARVVG